MLEKALELSLCLCFIALIIPAICMSVMMVITLIQYFINTGGMVW